MKIEKKFKEITSYQGDNFKEWFGDMEFEDKTSKLYSKKLERRMLDSEILSEFQPTELTLGEVFNYLKNEGNKEDWMIFYCKNNAGVLRAVCVFWFDVSWSVDADSVEYPYGWVDGCQVFSRNSFDTSIPQTLSPSDTLTLENAIKVVKENGYQVSKIY